MFVFTEVPESPPPHPENETKATANASTLPMLFQRGLRISQKHGKSMRATAGMLPDC
jgi:hypothetical protein